VALNLNGEITEVNKAAEAITGLSRELLLGLDFSTRFTDGQKARAGFRQALDEGFVHDYPLTVCHASGRTTEVLYNAVPYRDATALMHGVVATLHDITTRLFAEREYTRLLRRLAHAQEEERARISRELHDQLGQELTAFKLGLRLVKNQGSAVPAVGQSVAKLEQLAGQLMQTIHRLAWELHPAVLDDLGLETALRHYAEEWSKTNQVALAFHCTGMETARLAPDLETTLYRVTQEALTNVSRHARATRVNLLLERWAEMVSLIIEDDGAGFEAESVFQTARARNSLGLLGMQERVTLTGGTLRIESEPGAGATIFVRIPLGPEPSSGG